MQDRIDAVIRFAAWWAEEDSSNPYWFWGHEWDKGWLNSCNWDLEQEAESAYYSELSFDRHKDHRIDYVVNF